MPFLAALIIENGSFIGIFLVSALAAYAMYKRGMEAPGAGLAAVGFLIYGTYGLLAFTGPGFTGSFFRDFSKVGTLNMENFVYFITIGLRFGMVLIIAGIYQMARSSRMRA